MQAKGYKKANEWNTLNLLTENTSYKTQGMTLLHKGIY